MGRVFQKAFRDKAGIPDLALCRAVRDAVRGLIAADPGGGAIKQRIVRPGQGKSGGFRTPIVAGAGTRAIFVHGFAKNEKDNIEREDLGGPEETSSRNVGSMRGRRWRGWLRRQCCWR